MGANMSGDVKVYKLDEVRVMQIRAEPGTAILAITSGAQTTHYALSVDDLAGIAQRLRLDAILLMVKPPKSPSGNGGGDGLA